MTVCTARAVINRWELPARDGRYFINPEQDEKNISMETKRGIEE
jgi:hypothetical protein